MTKIAFDRSGGIVGRESCFGGSGYVSSERQEILQRLIDESQFFDIPENLLASATTDEFQYHITIMMITYSTVHASDTTMPCSLVPLVRIDHAEDARIASPATLAARHPNSTCKHACTVSSRLTARNCTYNRQMRLIDALRLPSAGYPSLLVPAVFPLSNWRGTASARDRHIHTHLGPANSSRR
jgi:hypothetical protein